MIAFQPNDGLTSTLLDINLRNSRDETPLALALAKGFTHLGQQMIQSGADVNVVDASGLSLLLQAVVSSNQASTSFLLQHGADITARSPHWLPLSWRGAQETPQLMGGGPPVPVLRPHMLPHFTDPYTTCATLPTTRHTLIHSNTHEHLYFEQTRQFLFYIYWKK